MTEINPGAIVLKEGETPHEVLLLVSGRVEKIRTRDNVFGSMSAGSLIGVGSILDNRPSHNTYRACSFLRVIRLPGGVYAEVIRRNGLLEQMRHTAKLRAFLDTTPLFSEGLPATALTRIVASMKEQRFKHGDAIRGDDLQTINIVRSGLIERRVGDKILDVLKERDFFGEEGAIFNVPYVSQLRVREETLVIQIPGEILQHVPLLRWKLFESYQQRVARAIYSGDPAAVFIWRDTFSSQVDELDVHHQQLIQIANTIMNQLQETANKDSLTGNFDALADCARNHFVKEERLMSHHDYTSANTHAQKHTCLLAQLTELQQRTHRGDIPDKASFQHFFESWLVRHVLKEDGKFGLFLRGRDLH